MKVFQKFLLLFMCALFVQACFDETRQQENREKIAGISLVAAPEKLKQGQVEQLRKINANYVTVMPLGFVQSLNHPEISYDSSRQWFGETKAGIRQYIKLLHKNELEIMLKPQLWIWHGEYTGNLKMTSEQNWKTFEAAYREFMLDFAKIAQENGVELFCIGTEMETFVRERPIFWSELIAAIKKTYHRKLTYAANWDEYQHTPF